MIKRVPVLLLTLLMGCAQFNGLESESHQGLIPELLILGSGKDTMVAQQELIQEQAQYYAATSRALYFQSMIPRDSKSSQEMYEEKALKAKEIALKAEDNVSYLSQ